MKIKDLATIVRNSVDPASLHGLVAHYSLPAFDDCGSALVQDVAEIESAKTQVKPGDVLISKLNPRIPRVQIVHDVDELRLLASGEFVVLRPHGVHPGFLKHYLSSPEVTDWLTANCQSVTRSHQRVSPAVIANIEIPLSLDFARIADFLDRETAEIDDLIGKQERLIELLAEKRQAIITHAVTKGLDPTAPTKPSGIPWLGDVAEHWMVVDLKHVVEVLTGFPFRSEDFSDDLDDVPLLRGVNINPGKTNWAETVRFSRARLDCYSTYLLAPGDLVLGLDRPIVSDGIRVCSIGEQDLPALLLQRVARIRTNDKADQSFVGHLLSSSVFANYLEPLFTGVSVPHMSPGQLGEFKIALPSMDEQKQVASSLNLSFNKLDALTDRARGAISLLRERRSALISAAVTGKIDVREGAA